MTAPRPVGTFALVLGAAAGLDPEMASQIARLQAVDGLHEIHVRVSGEDVDAAREMVSGNGSEKPVTVESASVTRDATIYEGLTSIRPRVGDEDLVLVADLERRSLTESAVSSCRAVAAEQGAAILVTQVDGDVILASEVGKVAALPREGWTFVAAGLLVARFSLMFDLYDWASTVASDSIGSPYRWSLRQLGAVAVVSDDRGAVKLAADVMQ